MYGLTTPGVEFERTSLEGNLGDRIQEFWDNRVLPMAFILVARSGLLRVIEIPNKKTNGSHIDFPELHLHPEPDFSGAVINEKANTKFPKIGEIELLDDTGFLAPRYSFQSTDRLIIPFIAKNSEDIDVASGVTNGRTIDLSADAIRIDLQANDVLNGKVGRQKRLVIGAILDLYTQRES